MDRCHSQCIADFAIRVHNGSKRHDVVSTPARLTATVPTRQVTPLASYPWQDDVYNQLVYAQLFCIALCLALGSTAANNTTPAGTS